MREKKVHCSCLCKQVQYSVAMGNLNMGICHCSMCRKNTGGTGFAFFYAASKPTFSHQTELKIYNAIGPNARFASNAEQLSIIIG